MRVFRYPGLTVFYRLNKAPSINAQFDTHYSYTSEWIETFIKKVSCTHMTG